MLQCSKQVTTGLAWTQWWGCTVASMIPVVTCLELCNSYIVRKAPTSRRPWTIRRKHRLDRHEKARGAAHVVFIDPFREPLVEGRSLRHLEHKRLILRIRCF